MGIVIPTQLNMTKGFNFESHKSIITTNWVHPKKNPFHIKNCSVCPISCEDQITYLLLRYDCIFKKI